MWPDRLSRPTLSLTFLTLPSAWLGDFLPFAVPSGRRPDCTCVQVRHRASLGEILLALCSSPNRSRSPPCLACFSNCSVSPATAGASTSTTFRETGGDPCCSDLLRALRRLVIRLWATSSRVSSLQSRGWFGATGRFGAAMLLSRRWRRSF